MADCLLALQRCSLIGLEDSPDFVRRSLLHRDGSQGCLLWDSKEAHHKNVAQRLAFTPAASDKHSDSCSLAQAVAACELNLRGDSGASILDCSLPLFSESPAIAGKQQPRARFRKRDKSGAAGNGAVATAGQPSILQQQPCKHPAAADINSADCLDNSHASSACMQSFSGILSPAGSSKHQQVLTSQQQWASQQRSLDKENQHPAAAPVAEDSGDLKKVATQHKHSNDLSALQALLDDSNCSAASMLHPSLATLPQGQACDAVGFGSCQNSFDLRCSIHQASLNSNVSEFQGFWHPRLAARSPFSTPRTAGAGAAGFPGASPSLMPTPTRLLLTAAAAGRKAAEEAALDIEQAPYCCNGAEGSLECLSSCESWPAATAEAADEQEHVSSDTEAEPAVTEAPVDVQHTQETPAAAPASSKSVAEQPPQHQQQPGWDQLLLLLSLDESVSLVQAASQSCGASMNGQVRADLPQGGAEAVDLPSVEELQQSPDTGCHLDENPHSKLEEQPAAANLQRPPSTGSSAASSPEPASPTAFVSPPAGLLSEAAGCSSWGGFGEGTGRYSGCCPSPGSPGIFGSPTVLLSSPVVGSEAVDACVAAGRPATRSRSVLGERARSSRAAAEPDVATPCQQPGPNNIAASAVAAAGGTYGSAGMLQQQQLQRPNSIEHSPIRGVTEWPSSTDACSWMASPSSMPLGKQIEQHQQLTLTPNAAAGNFSSPQWHLSQQQAAQPAQQQGADALLQQLLEDSCDSWIGPISSMQQPPTPSAAQAAIDGLHNAVDSPAAVAAVEYTTPQQCQSRQTAAGCSPGTAAAARVALPENLRLRLPEHQGALSMSPCVSPSRSPAESVDSFTCAAAGEPYSSVSLSPSEKASRQGRSLASILGQFDARQPQQRQGWRAYDGLGEMLTPGGATTPATVVCKNGWGQQVADKPAAVATPQPFAAPATPADAPGCTSAGKGSPVKWQQNPSADLDDSVAAASSAVDVATAVNSRGGVPELQDLAECLAAAEQQCTRHQQDAMQARQVVLEKELELQILRSALKLSEEEGSSCLDALAATIDIVAATDGSNSVRNSAEGSPAAKAAAVAEAGGASACISSGNLQLVQEVEQLQEQNAALQQHNAAMQATMAEAAQQLDLLEARVGELSAEKAAAEALLAEAEQQWNEQLRVQEESTQNELDEQQQQHEQEVRDLHNRLDDLAGQLQAAQQESSDVDESDSLEKIGAELDSCKQQVTASEAKVQELRQLLDGRASDSAASTEQLQRQVQQLLAAKRELQETNARLVDAEAEYASNQLTLGCRNQELSQQLKDAQAANKQLEDTVQQLQAQNSSLSQVCESLKASQQSGAAAAAAGPGASRTAATEAGPTPMRRRMAAANSQLERRCQELLEQKQQLALQLQQLQEQQTQQGASDIGTTETIEHQQALLQELQAQVEHLSACNDELLVQLQDFDCDHQQVLDEREQLVEQVAQLQDSLAQLQSPADGARNDCAKSPQAEDGAVANLQSVAEEQLRQQIAELTAENASVCSKYDALHQELSHTKQQLQEQQQQCYLLQSQLRAASAPAGDMEQQLQQQLLAAQQELEQLQQQHSLLQAQLASAGGAAVDAAQKHQQELAAVQATATAANTECQRLTAQLMAVQQQLADTQQQRNQLAQQQEREQQLQTSNTALFERCQELERQLQQMQSQLQSQQRELEQQFATATTPRGNKRNSKTSSAASNAADANVHAKDQVIAELRSRLKDVLDLLEEKQQLQTQQAKQFAAREAELDSKCKQLARELQQVQQEHLSLQAQLTELQAKLASTGSSNSQLLKESGRLQEQLAAAQAGKAAAEQAAAAAAMTAVEAERAAATAEKSVSELEQAVSRLQAQNQGLVEQIVQLQLVEPAAAAASSASRAVQVDLTAAAADGSSSAKLRKRWTSDLAVQCDLGATPEQAAAVQQLLLLQAQQQLQDMEQQNKLAAERLVESKARMAELQVSIHKQEQQLRVAEQQLAQASKLHKQQSASLHSENEQLVQKLSHAQQQLQVLQAANKQLEDKVIQQQKEVERQQQLPAQKQQEIQQQQDKLLLQQTELEKQSAALEASQQRVQSLQQQQTLDKLQITTAAAELQKAKEHAQQLLLAKDKEVQVVAALQQQVRQLQLQGQQQCQAVSGSEAAAAAAAAREAAVREELGRSQQQVQALLQEKDSLVVELQQTKVAVDFLEDSVRRLGQHNASLVQQLHDTISAAATATETAKSSASASSAAADHAGQLGAVAAASGPVSPRTLQQIITAATRVNEKNKKLKKQLQAMQGGKGGS